MLGELNGRVGERKQRREVYNRLGSYYEGLQERY